MSLIYSFGDWIRRRRKSLDLTQAVLAIQVGCSVVTIKKIEQDERRPSRLMAERLADCLCIPIPEQPSFIRAALSELSPDRLFPPATEFPASKIFTHLPQPFTPLIGRRKEISEAIHQLRHQTRLLTLTGIGGVGKTRLALAIALEIINEFRNGVVFVSLASIQDHVLVAAKIAMDLGLKESGEQSIREILTSFLSNQQILLVLDNFEHLLPSAPLLADLLLTAPELRLLVTSRALLHLSGEAVLTILPFNLPETSTTLDSNQYFHRISRSDAVRLFVTRARARYPVFRLVKENSHQVVEICRKLDGLPLAIELAASRVSEYPLETLHEGLLRRLDLLTDGYLDLPARQQTLRGTFDWSFAHLDAIEQDLFASFGVFSGGFTLEAALAVCGSYSRYDLLTGIRGLVDKNMVVRAGEERYNMLETAHEYALERLEIAEQTLYSRRTHLAYFMQLANQAAPHLWDKEQGEWLRRLTVEIDNFRGALRWALNREITDPEEVDMGARIAASLWYFWYLTGRLQEGQNWLILALNLVPQLNRTRARLLMADGTLLWQQGKLPMADSRLQESIDLLSFLEDEAGLAEAIHMHGHIVFDQRNYEEAKNIFQKSLSTYEALGDCVIRITLLGDLGLVACHQGDLVSARAYYEQCMELYIMYEIKDGEAQTYIRLGDVARLEGDYEKAGGFYEKSLLINRGLKISLEIACSLHKLGFSALHKGELHQAQALFRESLALQHEFGNQQGMAECLAGLASVDVYVGRYEEAARNFCAARRILTKTGLPIGPADLAEWQRDEEKARSKCGSKQFELAWSKGMDDPVEFIIKSVLPEVPLLKS
ncbi:MAG: XRE family transcriptional regulator [Chloroflexi bacterium]|nr:MAG: XRE family transcriptional regulator [Chloroflexota bacterium]MBA4376512.1 hypothetical protein [Anaerolinea sp.]